jgi:hypothetical protein
MASAAVPAFRHYLINGKIFGKKKAFEPKMHVLISLHILSEKFCILRRINGAIVINAKTSFCK